MRSAIFFHIPKTAGTTLTELIIKNNSPGSYYHFRKEEKPTWEGISGQADQEKFVWGHFRFMPELVGEDFFLLSFLREPVARSISQFRHLRREGYQEGKPLLEQMEYFLTEKQVELNGSFNFQTQFMCGPVRQRDVFADPQKHLELASENLQKLDFVGITEEFRESAFTLGYLLGWKKWYYVPHNVHANHEEEELIRKNFGNRLKEINEMDVELYRRAREVFRHQQENNRLPKWQRLKAVGLSRLKGIVKG